MSVVLRECAWHEEVVVESRHIARRIGVALDREPGDPRLPTRGSTNGRFAKRGVVPIPLEDLAELMIVALSRNRRARRHDVSVLDQELSDRTGVVASRLEGFDIRLARGRQHLAIRRAAVAILVGKAGRGEEGSAAAAIPEHARTHDASRIAREIGPRIVVDVVGLLPVAATEQRTAPAAREGTGEKRDRISRASCGPIEQELLRGFSAWPPRQQVDDATHRAGAI